MSKLIKEITCYVEENLTSLGEYNFDEDKILKAFIPYRISLFKTIFFSIIYRKTNLLKKNIFIDPNIIKNTMVLFNNMVDEVNSCLLGLEFNVFNIELTKNETIPIIVKKNPYKHLLKSIKSVSEIAEEDFNKPCKPVMGLLTFVIYHKTKTKTELSINVISDIKSIKNESQFKDVSGIIESRNHNILRELNIIVESYLQPLVIKKFIPNLNVSDTFKEIESDLFYGFIGTLTFNKQGIDDITDVLDMFYYPDKYFLPLFKIYYSVFQFKKESKKYLYLDVDDLVTDNFLSIIKQNSVEYTEPIYKRACLFYENMTTISQKIYNPLKFYLYAEQNICEKSDRSNRIKVRVVMVNKDGSRVGKRIFLGAKEILYNNIIHGNYYILINQQLLLPEHILYNKDIFTTNLLFKHIQENFILTNNEVLRIKSNLYKDKQLDLIYKINPTHMPWDKFIVFYNNLEESKMYETPEDIFELICKFKNYDTINGDKIITMFLYTPLTNIFKDIYLDVTDEEIKKFQMFYEKTFFVNNNCSLETTTIVDNDFIYKDFIFIFELILLIIKHF